MHIALVAGETSGDILGASLIQAIKDKHPHATFSGVAGARMVAAGCELLEPVDSIACMGIFEPLKKLPKLLAVRRAIMKRYTENPPDCFIGIDAPEFNLSIEKKLHSQGVKIVHYASPQVWAWRSGRAKQFSTFMDCLLTLFPFESEFYKDYKLNTHYIGHPLADQIPLEPNTHAAREKLGLENELPIVTLLPGSRARTMAYLLPEFIKAIKTCQQKGQHYCWLIACSNEQRKSEAEKLLRKADLAGIDVKLFVGQTRTVVEAADVVLSTSGTSTLETMLLKKPMIVVYKMSALAHWLLRRMVHVDKIALPNLILGKHIVPELIQNDINPEKISQLLAQELGATELRQDMIDQFYTAHHLLKQNASEQAATQVLKVIQDDR